MRKLYFKKLISILGHFALCYAIYFIGFSILSLIANFFKNDLVRICIAFGIPLILVLIRVFNRRVENQEMRRAYLADANRERFVFREEWVRICKFPHFRAEVLAFATLDLVITVIILFWVTASWRGYLLLALIFFAAPCAIFFSIDFLLWLKVHNTWRKAA